MTQQRRNKAKTFIFIGIYILMMLWFASCQTPDKKTRLSGAEAVITRSLICQTDDRVRENIISEIENTGNKIITVVL